MPIAILVDENLLAKKGLVELTVNRTFQINMTADEARRHVHSWLIDEISSNIGAEIPTLVLANRPVWRVPAWLSFPHYGRVGAVGSVDVDVETGKIYKTAQCKAEIERTAEALAQRLSSYPTKQVMAVHLQANVPAAPKLVLAADELVPEDEFAKDLMLEAAN